MTAQTLGPAPPTNTGDLAKNFDGSTPSQLYAGMVPNFEHGNNTAALGQDVDVQWAWPRLGLGESLTRRQWYLQQSTNTTSIEKFNCNTPTETGTKTATNPTTGGVAGIDGSTINWATTAVIGNVAGFDTFSSGFQRREMRPSFATVIRTPATITSQRIWVGLFNATPSAADDPTLHGIGFRYTTNAVTGQNNWIGWANDNSGGGGILNSGVAVAASTRYELAFFCPTASSVAFFINGLYLGVLTSGLPTATVNLDVCVQTTALAASARTISWIRSAGHSN